MGMYNHLGGITAPCPTCGHEFHLNDADLLNLLENIEWSAEIPYHIPACPNCFGPEKPKGKRNSKNRKYGHTVECKLGNLIKTLRFRRAEDIADKIIRGQRNQGRICYQCKKPILPEHSICQKDGEISHWNCGDLTDGPGE